MRIAVVTDIHGNLTAFEAVLADLRAMAPDAIVHGGDLADSGSSPVEIVDRIRELGWAGVAGNTDEMLFRPASLEEFAAQSTAPPALWAATREMAAATRALLGEERLAWLRSLPRLQVWEDTALVHGSAASCWRAPAAGAGDEELEAAYGTLGRPTAVYGHIHTPFLRTLGRDGSRPGMVANTGSVGLPWDGDARASYLLADGESLKIRRVAYAVEREVRQRTASGLPYAEWIAGMLRSGRPQMPPAAP